MRSEEDRQAVLAALKDGTIDAIASDHQPRDADDKRLPFAEASPGGAGLVTLLGVTLAQVQSGHLTLAAGAGAADLPACRVARHRGRGAAPGRRGRSLPVPPGALLAVTAGKLPGKGQNTPFDGRALEGVVLGTWKAGKRVFG